MLAEQNHLGWTGWQRRILLTVVTLLLLSSFRAPETMEELAPAIASMKSLIRLFIFCGLFGLSFLFLSYAHVRRNVVCYIPFFAFVAWGGFTVLWSARKAESAGQVLSISCLVLMAFVISAVVRSERELRELLRWTVVNLIVICLFLLVTGLLIPSTGHMTRDGMGVGHSTNCGSTTSLGLLLLVLCGMLWKWRWTVRWMAPGCLVFAAVSVLSANRLSMGITAIMLPTIILFFGGRFWMGAMCVGIALLGTFFPMVDPKLESIGRGMDAFNRGQSSDEISSLSGRQVMWEAMWNSFLDSPIRGHGYFMSSKGGELEVWYLHDELMPVNWTAHNIWLQAMVSTGVVGLLLIMTAMGLPLVSLIFSRIAERSWDRIDSWMVTLAIWYLAWGMLNESILGPLQPESVVFFIFYGVAIARLTRSFSTSKRRSPTAPGNMNVPSGHPGSQVPMT